MGRKPDILIATYFNRGSKLLDASNRYSYTCRGCGLLFPRGRTNHLLDHLIGNASRCPALTAEDHATIMAVQASKSAEKAQRASSKRTAAYGLLEHDAHTNDQFRQAKRQALQLNGEAGSLSGLEALAEASRRMERPFNVAGNVHDGSGYDESFLIDPSLNSVLEFSESLQVPPSDPLGASVTPQTSDESALESRGRSRTDESSRVGQIMSHGAQADGFVEQMTRAVNFPILIAANASIEITQESGNMPLGKITKTRSKFSEARREEVRGIRSKRACIRCRMLRKPCSAEDPCSRCASIKNPRLWSSRCIRGRLADVGDLFSAKLNTQIIKSLVNKSDDSDCNKDLDDVLVIHHADEANSTTEMHVTAVHRPSQKEQSGMLLVVIVPGYTGHDTYQKLRSLICSTGIEDLPPHVQRAMMYGRGLEAESGLQLYRKAEFLYICTRLMISKSIDYKMSLQSESNHALEAAYSLQAKKSLQSLAFRAMLEFFAEQCCHSFLKDLEQALITRSLPSSAVLISAIMLFLSLDLLEHEFRRRQQAQEWHQPQPSLQETPPIHLQWPLSDSCADWLARLDDFSSFMQDLLRYRHITEGLGIGDDGLLRASVSTGDDALNRLFAALKIDQALLGMDGASFASDDIDSVSFKHAARMFLAALG